MSEFFNTRNTENVTITCGIDKLDRVIEPKEGHPDFMITRPPNDREIVNKINEIIEFLDREASILGGRK